MKSVPVISSISDLFDAFGGTAALARAVGVKPSRAGEWKRTNSIPAPFHKPIVDAALLFGIDGVTADVIDRICAQQPSVTAAE